MRSPLSAISLLLVTLACARSAIAVPQEPPLARGDEVVVTRGPADLRVGKNVVARIPDGTRLRVTKVEGRWVGCVGKVDGEEKRGWVDAAQLASDTAQRTEAAAGGKPFVVTSLKFDQATKELVVVARVSGATKIDRLDGPNSALWLAVGYDKLEGPKGLKTVQGKLREAAAKEKSTAEKTTAILDLWLNIYRSDIKVSRSDEGQAVGTITARFDLEEIGSPMSIWMRNDDLSPRNDIQLQLLLIFWDKDYQLGSHSRAVLDWKRGSATLEK